MKDIQRQEWNEELEKSKFAKKMKRLIETEREIYEREKIKKNKERLRNYDEIQNGE